MVSVVKTKAPAVRRCTARSQKKPPLVRYGLPWCAKHDAYAPRRYDPFCQEIHGHLVAEFLCDTCYYESSAEI